MPTKAYTGIAAAIALLKQGATLNVRRSGSYWNQWLAVKGRAYPIRDNTLDKLRIRGLIRCIGGRGDVITNSYIYNDPSAAPAAAAPDKSKAASGE